MRHLEHVGYNRPLFLRKHFRCMKTALPLFLLLCIVLNTYAQQHSYKVLADKIVARVGNEIILKSDIDPNIKTNDNNDPTKEKCELLRQITAQKTLLLQAKKDSIKIEDDEIEAELNKRIAYFIGLYGKEGLEEIAGKTVYQIKEDHRETVLQQKMSDLMYHVLNENIQVSPAEVKAYYQKIPKDSLHFYETELQVKQIIVYAKNNPELEQYNKNELQEYKRLCESGQVSFEKLAGLHSDDANTKSKGGFFSFNRSDKNIEQVLKTIAFGLKPGQISNPIKSSAGYHIVQLLSRSGDDFTVRHILKTPRYTDTEIIQSLQQMDSIRSNLIVRTISFEQAVEKYSEHAESKFTGGYILNPSGSSLLSINQLDADVLAAYSSSLAPGEYSKPFTYTDASGRKAARLIYLASKTQPHQENLKDDYAAIAERLKQEKKAAAFEKWFKTNIDRHYVVLDKRYACNLTNHIKQ